MVELDVVVVVVEVVDDEVVDDEVEVVDELVVVDPDGGRSNSLLTAGVTWSAMLFCPSGVGWKGAWLSKLSGSYMW